MRQTCGGNLALLKKKWRRQPMFSRPPKIRLGGKKRRRKR